MTRAGEKRLLWTASEDDALKTMFAAGEPFDIIASRIGRTASSVAHRARLIKLKRKRSYVSQYRPMPDDFVEVAATISENRACQRWNTHYKQARRWYAEAGISPMPPRSRPEPEGFVDAARCMTTSELMARYGLTYDAVRTLRRRHNLPAHTSPQPKQPTAPAAPRPFTLMNRGNRGQVLRVEADDSRGGQAADHLRRRGYTPVHRARVTNPQAPRDAWIVGRRQMPEDEMIDLACLKGFVRFDALPARSSQEGARA